MGRIPEEDVERVRDATDIVSLVAETVQLKQKGRLWWGCCPFHAEKTPSFKVDPASGLWHCFGCGTGGDAIGFVMKTEHLDFPDAVRRLAERARIEIREESGGMPSGLKERLLAASAEAAAFYHRLLISSKDKGAADARAYLKRRGIGIEVAKRFDMGFAPSNGSPLVAHLRAKGFTPDELVTAGLAVTGDRGLRDRFFGRVMFPIADLAGRTIAFGGRVLGDGAPKYLNSAETPLFHKSSNLYAIDRAKNEIVKTGTAVVVEGYTDVIALHVAGLPFTVATLGTALTAQHVKLLARFAKRVVYLFDGDDAGMRAARRAEEFLEWQALPEVSDGRIDLRVALIPDGLDPADFVEQRGAEALRELVDGAQPLLRFLVEQRVAARDTSSPEGRSAALKDGAGLLARLKDSLLVHDYANLLADMLHVDYPTVQQAVLAAAPAKGGRDAGAAREEAGARPSSGAAPAARLTDPQSLAEEELLGVVARRPRLRREAWELLASGAMTDTGRQKLLAVVLEAGDAVGRDLFEFVAGREPSLADAASAYIVDEGEPERDEENFRQLVSRLKEFSVKRQILQVQSRLQELDPVKHRQDHDDALREAMALRAQLDAIVRTRLTGSTGHGGVKA